MADVGGHVPPAHDQHINYYHQEPLIINSNEVNQNGSFIGDNWILVNGRKSTQKLHSSIKSTQKLHKVAISTKLTH
jgi:hypothetical protein